MFVSNDLKRRSVAALLMLATPQPASASSCVNPKTESISFAKGARCWTYQGDATHFRGAFRAGQSVVASSTGIANFSDGKWDWRTTEARGLSANGPGGIAIVLNNGERDSSFTVPRTGLYTFDFSPCAMWHAQGTFIVCAK
jgi:hypothetical protein